MGNWHEGCVCQKRGDVTLCRHVPWRWPHAGRLICLLLSIFFIFTSWLMLLAFPIFPPRFFIVGTAFRHTLFLTTSSLFHIYCLCRNCTFWRSKSEAIASIQFVTTKLLSPSQKFPLFLDILAPSMTLSLSRFLVLFFIIIKKALDQIYRNILLQN